MLFFYVTASLLLALVAYQVKNRVSAARQQDVLGRATSVGAVFDAEGNINARASYARMLAEEQESGVPFIGKQAVFMELTRLIAEGPKTPHEIRFLLNAGYETIVRPDGLVYVPCVENEHLEMDGEIPLVEADLAVLEE